ncbi:MAG: hypothetical protein WA782_08020 [Sulfitobacter sp.]
MPKKAKTNPNAADGTSARMSTFDQIVEKTASSVKTVRKDGEPKEMTMEEIIFEKLTQTALSGSPHALRQWIEHNQVADEKRAAKIAEDVKIWSAYKRTKYAELEAHRKAELPEPIIIPHPDDVTIDDETGVTFDGPLIRADYDLAIQTRCVIDATLLQEALDRRKAKKKSWPAPVAGDPMTTVLIFNKMLGKRMSYSQNQLIDRRMGLASLSIRDLEKMTFQAWKKAGLPRPRGSAGFAPRLMSGILQMSVEAAKIACNEDLSKDEKDAEIDQLVHRIFG